MSVSKVQAEQILLDVIKESLRDGTPPTIEEIKEAYDATVASLTLGEPTFSADNARVSRLENASASKYNNTLNSIHEDLITGYRSLYDSTERATKLFSRWQAKANRIENRIIALETRVNRLLALAEDTVGFFDSVGDNFANTNLIDLDRSSNLNINLPQNQISMKSSGSDAVSRVFLTEVKDATFAVITNSTVVSKHDVQNTKPSNAFSDQNTFWKTDVYCSSRLAPMIASLSVTFGATLELSCITFLLHESASNSTTTITPMYSTDGANYQRLPTDAQSLVGTSSVQFCFPSTEMTHLKIFFEKSGHDFTTQDNLFVYEFGAKEIGLYEEAFPTDSSFRGKLISKPLSITDENGDLTVFSKATLEVCEYIDDDTDIDYFIAIARNSSETPEWLTSSGFSTTYIENSSDIRLWTPIQPINRVAESVNPRLLDFSSVTKTEYTGIGLSYDRDAVEDLRSPASAWTLITSDSGSLTTSLAQNKTPSNISGRRYFSGSPNVHILNYQIDTSLSIDFNSLELWRNVGERGIAPGDSSKKVRGVQIGWEYTDPYYETTVKVSSLNGLRMDVGNGEIIIDGKAYSGVVDETVLDTGTHKVRVHKKYWREVEPNLTTLDALKAADPLYPFNQKLLIEGYSYDLTYPDESEKVYTGVERFAGAKADRVGIFDLIENIRPGDYSKFSLDFDAPSTSEVIATSADTPLSYVIAVNTDPSYGDFPNEKFVLEFRLTDELFSYIALKAELKTNDGQKTPVFDEYRIKLAT